VLAEAISAAGEAGDGALEEYARLVRLRMRVQTDAEHSAEEVVDGARRALDAFGAVDDGAALKAWEPRPGSLARMPCGGDGGCAAHS
jgi:hypothetical protein